MEVLLLKKNIKKKKSKIKNIMLIIKNKIVLKINLKTITSKVVIII